MSDSTFVLDGHAYEGALMPWGDDMALMVETACEVLPRLGSLRVAWADLQEDPDADVVSAGLSVMVDHLPGILRDLGPVGVSLTLRWLDGWTRDGKPCDPQSLRGAGMEPFVAAVEVADRHGLFRPSPGLLTAIRARLPQAADLWGILPDAVVETTDGEPSAASTG